ncbi:MAG: CCA tRNA nucleotidyltransferase, partial [Methanoregula sp.]
MVSGLNEGTGRLPLEEKILAEQLRPSAEEREYIQCMAGRLLAAIKESGKAEGMVVGSIARNTWVKGDRDLDVFMLFPPEMPREALEAEGLALARSIARKFTNTFCEKYAEHPYINATIDSIDVDLVPCYNVASAAHIQSAVDRTPFHTRYITEKINGLIDDVLLLKRFAKAGGIYGSDQMTEGFSGYLCELLVLHYGGFTHLLKAASAWGPHLKIDIEHHAAKVFDEPLIVIDPVDPRRNVAAAVSMDRMAEFIELARGYLEAPSEAFFTLPEEKPVSQEELAAILASRGTGLYAITFATPPFIDEIVVPQLRRSTGSVCELLTRSGFVVHHAHYRMGKERCMLLFELLIDELPPIRRHEGPPVWNRANAE